MSITFHKADVKLRVPRATLLKQFIASQIPKNKHRAIEISIVFCSDPYLLDINKRFLNHNYFTDIITFPLSNTPDLLEAEIYISAERVKENAERFELSGQKKLAEYGSRYNRELHRVIFHGVLHLLGYNDKNDKQAKEMRAAEDKWLQAYNTKYLMVK